MLIEATNLEGLEVITDKGLSLGYVEDVIVDLESGEVYELLVSDTNEELVEDGASVGVPYRWIQSISRVVLLKHFPGKIKRKEQFEIPAVSPDGKRRKLRVVKKQYGDGGVGRLGWR
ncbi:MAG TPA: photosystem reaction center subunit H [Euryarchaeota archaeon]|nr:MAG: photosystem reaction center subunit H [Thermoplasmatales archaeon ex4484_6]RLF67005.1 MAG: photosystem reaction center subunit H [Thermoplasmata archaeon]HHD15891.1 photosystem reaction center subunit H [Euryarchaeota archaeon]